MTIENIHDQSPRKYWAWIELTIPVSAIQHTTDCSTGPGPFGVPILFKWTLYPLFSFGPI